MTRDNCITPKCVNAVYYSGGEYCYQCLERFPPHLLTKEEQIIMSENDNVNHPTHYNQGKIEVIEAIEDWKLDFHSGNAVKYIARAGKKDPNKLIEDLEKAIWYITRKIAVIKANPSKPNDMPIPRS